MSANNLDPANLEVMSNVNVPGLTPAQESHLQDYTNLVSNLENKFLDAEREIKNVFNILTAVINAQNFIIGQGIRIPAELKQRIATLQTQITGIHKLHQDVESILTNNSTTSTPEILSSEAQLSIGEQAEQLIVAFVELLKEPENEELRNQAIAVALETYMCFSQESPADAAKEQTLSILADMNATGMQNLSIKALIAALKVGMDHYDFFFIEDYSTTIQLTTAQQQMLGAHANSKAEEFKKALAAVNAEAITLIRTEALQLQAKYEEQQIEHRKIQAQLQEIRDDLWRLIQGLGDDNLQLVEKNIEAFCEQKPSLIVPNKETAQKMILEQVTSAYCEVLGFNGDLLNEFLQNFDDNHHNIIRSWVNHPDFQKASSDLRKKLFVAFEQRMFANDQVLAGDAISEALISLADAHIAEVSATLTASAPVPLGILHAQKLYNMDDSADEELLDEEIIKSKHKRDSSLTSSSSTASNNDSEPRRRTPPSR